MRLVKFLDMLFNLLPHKFIKFPIGNYWDRNKMKNYKFYPFNYRLSEEAPYFNSENFLREDSKNLKSKIYNF